MPIGRIREGYLKFVERERAPLAVILCIGGVIRLFMLLASGGILWPDSDAYYRSAQHIAFHGDFLEHSPYRTVLYPLFLSLFLSAGGETAGVGIAVAVAQSLLGLLTACFLYKIARRVFGSGVAFAAVLLFTVRPLQLYYEQCIETESLFIMLLSATLCYALSTFDRFDAEEPGSLRRFLWLGGLSGVLTLTRPIGKLILAVLCALDALWNKRWKRFTVFACGALIVHCMVLLPWMAVNQARFGTFSLSIDFGLNLFHRVIDVDRVALPERTKYPGIKAMVRESRAKSDEVTYFQIYHPLVRSGLGASEVDRRMKAFALEALRGHYLLFAGNTLKTFAEFFLWARDSVHFCGSDLGPYPCAPQYRNVRLPAFLNKPISSWSFPRYLIRGYFRLFHIPLMWLAAILMLWGAVAFLLREKTKRTQAALLLAALLYFTGLAALLNRAEDRFRLPVDGLIFMFAAYAVSLWFSRQDRF